MNVSAARYHDISCGHRVVGHEGKCRHLHGHNYRIHFTCEAEEGRLDKVGRVVDFSVIKERLCMWLENNWDHKFLVWRSDPVCIEIYDTLGSDSDGNAVGEIGESFVFVPFNPTAENMATYLLEVVGPEQLKNLDVRLTKVVIEETAKCSAEVTRG